MADSKKFLFYCFSNNVIPINISPNDIIDFDDTKYKFVINKKNNTNKILDITTKDICQAERLSLVRCSIKNKAPLGGPMNSRGG